MDFKNGKRRAVYCAWPLLFHINKPLIVSNEEHRLLVSEQLRETGIEFGAALLVPVGRNTAPAMNHSHSARNALRGLHYQILQLQGKLVRMVQNEVFDVAVDLDKPLITGNRQRKPHSGERTAALGAGRLHARIRRALGYGRVSLQDQRLLRAGA